METTITDVDELQHMCCKRWLCISWNIVITPHNIEKDMLVGTFRTRGALRFDHSWYFAWLIQTIYTKNAVFYIVLAHAFMWSKLCSFDQSAYYIVLGYKSVVMHCWEYFIIVYLYLLSIPCDYKLLLSQQIQPVCVSQSWSLFEGSSK